jgi:hypothetical protein
MRLYRERASVATQLVAARRYFRQPCRQADDITRIELPKYEWEHRDNVVGLHKTCRTRLFRWAQCSDGGRFLIAAKIKILDRINGLENVILRYVCS